MPDLGVMIDEVAKRAAAAGIAFDPSGVTVQFVFAAPGYTSDPKDAWKRSFTSMALAHIAGSGFSETELAAEVVRSASEHFGNARDWMPTIPAALTETHSE